MATTDFPVNHALAVKLYSRALMREALNQTMVSKFFGKGSNAMIQIKDETSKGAGDKITVGLRVLLNGDGVEGDATLEGNEEALQFYSDSVLINQLRHATRSKGKMSEQRVPYNLREEAKDALALWFAERIETAVFNQLGGNTGVTDTKKTGHNATVAPSASHIIWPTGLSTEAAVASASASNIMTLAKIDACVEKAKTLRNISSLPVVRPLMIRGEKHYVMFLHPHQVYDLRTNTNTGQWLDIQKAAMQGGKVGENPIFTGALGVYNNVILHESEYVPSVTTNVRRALFCGAQAGVIAYGQKYGDGEQAWTEELFDFKNQLGVAGSMIWGCKKLQYNSNDFGVITVPTYAVAHS